MQEILICTYFLIQFNEEIKVIYIVVILNDKRSLYEP